MHRDKILQIERRGAAFGLRFVVIANHFLGIRCGYVMIPAGHPLWKQKNHNLYPHGGVTYSQFGLPRGKHCGWVIGFDAGHMGTKDLPDPSLIDPRHKLFQTWKQLAEMLRWGDEFCPTVKRVDFMVREAKALAHEVSTIAPKRRLRPDEIRKQLLEVGVEPTEKLVAWASGDSPRFTPHERRLIGRLIRRGVISKHPFSR